MRSPPPPPHPTHPHGAPPQVLESRLYSEGLHVLGQPPAPDQMAQYLAAYFGTALPAGAADAVVAVEVGVGWGEQEVQAAAAGLERAFGQPSVEPAPTSAGAAGSSSSGDGGGSNGAGGDGEEPRSLGQTMEEALRIRQLLQRNSEELTGVLRALNGEYILPEAGGDLLRDGAGGLWV